MTDYNFHLPPAPPPKTFLDPPLITKRNNLSVYNQNVNISSAWSLLTTTSTDKQIQVDDSNETAAGVYI